MGGNRLGFGNWFGVRFVNKTGPQVIAEFDFTDDEIWPRPRCEDCKETKVLDGGRAEWGCPRCESPACERC